ncbi:MAG: hypothetical protein PHP11_01740 [Erysipelotrichaceae bacterium]|nr:hypothetical protein [Erysipelotrichaceae bacterium]MDD3923808.1 hypothetical protein [Erysipelotrichaceae bacterium]MDD4641885.1 hypothetical protein [Erysipelotrichaceae bacterium]
MNDLLMIFLLVIALTLSALTVLINIVYHKKIKDKDRIFNILLALGLMSVSLYYLWSNQWCYTCSVYNNYLLYGGFSVLAGWMLFDLYKEIRRNKDEH